MANKLLFCFFVFDFEVGPQPGFKLWGAKHIFKGKCFCFYYMFKANCDVIFWAQQNLGSTKKFGEATPPWLQAYFDAR